MRFWGPLTIGLVQIVGQVLGSTTLTGATIYEVTGVGWWVYTIVLRQWGFVPLNVFGLAVSTYTLWRLI